MSIDLSISRRLSTVRELVGAEVLIIDQDPAVQEGMQRLLSQADLHVSCASTPEEGLELLAKRFFAVVIVDLDTPTPGTGHHTIAAIKDQSPTSMVVILTPRKSFDDAVAAIRAGAIDVVLKHPDAVNYLKERILEAASRSVDRREVRAVLTDAKEVHDNFLRLFMEAERQALDLADQVAGRNPDEAAALGELRVLVVDADSSLGDSLTASAGDGYLFENALSGGQALDLAGSNPYHYVMVSNNLFDLPSSMVARSVKSQRPDVVVLMYSGPGPEGKVELIESSGQERMVIPEFSHANQLIERLEELAEAFRAKMRERRYAQAFREKHYDFLRRYVRLKDKVERALNEMA